MTRTRQFLLQAFVLNAFTFCLNGLIAYWWFFRAPNNNWVGIVPLAFMPLGVFACWDVVRTLKVLKR
jgi:hypothetical protein